MATNASAKRQEDKQETNSTSEDDEGEDDEDDTESEEEPDEPKLKYERLTNDLNAILSKDAASCIAVHTKFLALGTHWGMIFILDHTGNNIRDKEIMAHTTTVNQISIDERGEYLASCSDDGKVMIAGLYGTEYNQTISFDRPVKSVGIDPYFTKSGRRQFACGEEKLVLNEKSGIFRTNKAVTIHQGEGPVRNIKWRADFIAWANDEGVRVYHTSVRRIITKIPKTHNYRTDLYGCQLCWKDDVTLLVGWADTVKVCIVKEKVLQEVPQDAPRHVVEIVQTFSSDFFICGIAPLGSHLVLLTYDKDGMRQECTNLLHNSSPFLVETYTSGPPSVGWHRDNKGSNSQHDPTTVLLL